MKHYEIPAIQMEYPIGGHMKINHAAFRELANQFFKKADKKLKAVEYISLVCRGSSGAIGATIFYSEIMNKYPNIVEIRINHVKKEGEAAHSGSNDGMFFFNSRKEILYVLVDDFSNTGDTLYACYDAMPFDFGMFDYIVVKYVHRRVLDRMKEKPITKTLIAKIE